jgi:hypothetical protein
MNARMFFAAVALALAAGGAFAETPAARLASITWENDFFAGYDRHYTNGVQAAFLVGRDSLPTVLRELPPVSWSRDPDVVFAVGQRIYTPTDTLAAVPDPLDRPYAGWLYAMLDVQTASGTVVDHLTTSIGMVGPAAGARHTQNAAHRLFGKDVAHGWSSQIGNEPTFMLGFERAWRDVASGRLGENRFDLALRAGGAVGNALTYASAGAVVRYGRNLPSDLPVTHISLGPPRDGYRGASDFGWYAWAGVDARAVGRNIFLDGTGEDPGVDRRPFGYDLQAGFALAWPEARIGFTLVERSREFDGQQGPDRFGQLALSFAY